MEEVLTRLGSLSADELREEFLKAQLKCGAITATTRAIFERKLARALLDCAPPGEGYHEGPNPPGEGHHEGPTPPGEEYDVGPTPPEDVGYHLGLNPPEEEPLTQRSGSAPQTPGKVAQASTSCFYGVCPLWEDVLAPSERVHVYTDKKEALQVVRMMKGARFKAFTSRDQAESFARGLSDYCPSPSKSAPCLSPIRAPLAFSKEGVCVLETECVMSREKANTFKSPRTQDLTARLRVCVERGDEAGFTELVWSNPRYLIGSGDNPTVLQEGCRYNVMHVAAKENQAGVARLLLETLENPEFMRLMYPDDSESMLHQRIHYITDLYLNTPDKAGFETPLHFACKFGCAEVVNVLCSHPHTDKHCRNRYHHKPSQIVCDRMKEKSKAPELRRKIAEYLEDRCYVPLLRAADNSAQPVIGATWSPEAPEDPSPRLPRSPRDPLMTVRAFAGPLSPSKADEFRRVWKTPPRDRAESLHHILKSDPERGAERVGRDLARELGHPWAEYWDFLDRFVDLAAPDGLRRLEDFLCRKERGENEGGNSFRSPSPGRPRRVSNSVSVGAFLDESDVSLEEMKNRQNAALTSGITSCAPAEDAGGRGFHILPVIQPPGPAPSPCSPPPPVSDLTAEFERMALSDGPAHQGAELSGDSPDQFFLAPESPGGAGAGTRTACSRSRSWDHGSSASSAGSSSSDSYRSMEGSNDLIVTTPPRVRKGLFIQGDSPTRLDREVYTALMKADIDPLKFPSIQRWRSTVQSYSSEERQSWQTPALLKTPSRLQALTPGSPASRYSPARHAHSPDDITSPGRYSPAHASYIQRIRLKHFGDSPI